MSLDVTKALFLSPCLLPQLLSPAGFCPYPIVLPTHNDLVATRTACLSTIAVVSTALFYSAGQREHSKSGWDYLPVWRSVIDWLQWVHYCCNCVVDLAWIGLRILYLFEFEYFCINLSRVQSPVGALFVGHCSLVLFDCWAGFCSQFKQNCSEFGCGELH